MTRPVQGEELSTAAGHSPTNKLVLPDSLFTLEAAERGRSEKAQK